MRPFLYLSPYFPPDARVGALRPLKFVRHLPALGFRPVVLCDPAHGRTDARLLAALPPDVLVERRYGRRSRKASAASLTSAPRWLDVLTEPLASSLRGLLDTPELVPLGPHALDIPHALRAAEELIERHHCELVLVNADPFAAAVVGALLAKRHTLPLVVDFRDPWALCALRSPLRRRWVQRSVAALERLVVERAQRVILNTETARADYASYYHELAPERFVCVPNHADATLTPLPTTAPKAHGERSGRFTLLVAGTLRRFVEGAALVELLVALKAQGFSADQLGLTLVGQASEEFLRQALERGVLEYVSLREPVSYLDVPSVQGEADLLVVLGHRDQQRIPAKLYDAALSQRPVLVVTENSELVELCQRIGGARAFAHADVTGMAEWVRALAACAERPGIERNFSWNSQLASARLAEHLTRALDDGQAALGFGGLSGKCAREAGVRRGGLTPAQP